MPGLKRCWMVLRGDVRWREFGLLAADDAQRFQPAQLLEGSGSEEYYGTASYQEEFLALLRKHSTGVDEGCWGEAKR